MNQSLQEVLIKAKLYFIGCGPGDRNLITLKGEEYLKKSDIIFYFPPYNDIFSDLVKNKRKFFYFDYTFEEIKNIIEEALTTNKNIAFMVPGDLSIFSPFSAFLNCFNQQIEVIPGVGTFNYFAAKLKKILNPPDNILSISIIGPKVLHEKIGDFEFSDFTSDKSTLIIYMNDMDINELITNLTKIYSCNTGIYIGIDLSLHSERIIKGTLADIRKKTENINLKKEKFVTVIVGNIRELPLNIKWWDDKVKAYSDN